MNVLGSKEGAEKVTKATKTMVVGERVKRAKSVAGTVQNTYYMVPKKPRTLFFRDAERSTLDGACKTDAVGSLVF